MNKKVLQQSIALIGPSGVGKSLLSAELSKETKLPVISIDDLKYFASLEEDGYLSPNIDDKDKMIENIVSELSAIKKTYINPNNNVALNALRKSVTKTIENYFEMIKLFGDLSFVKKNMDALYSDSYYFSPISQNPKFLVLINAISSIKMIEDILAKINSPIILDCSSTVGWQFPKNFLEDDEKKLCDKVDSNIKIPLINKITKDLLKQIKTVVAIDPSTDYEKRKNFDNAASTSLNKILLNNFQNYYTNANLIIATNSLFFETDPKILGNRHWFNTYVEMEKEKNKDKAELKNLCYQILEAHKTNLSKSN